MNITSPPYVGEFANLATLYKQLQALKAWVLNVVEDEQIPLAPNVTTMRIANAIPAFETFITQPVRQLSLNHERIREIREAWDTLLREFEDNWTDDRAGIGRCGLVTCAIGAVLDCYLPGEARELQVTKARAEKLQAAKLHASIVLLAKQQEDDPDNAPDNAKPSDNDDVY